MFYANSFFVFVVSYLTNANLKSWWTEQEISHLWLNCYFRGHFYL